jgi:hypothetical protein
MLLIANGVLPTFVRVDVFAALVVPTSCPSKPRLAGLKLTAGAVPVPVSGTLCGLFAASSVIVTAALRPPAAAGANVTEIVQLALTASVAGATGHPFVWS